MSNPEEVKQVGEEVMNAMNIRLKRVRTMREAVGLGFFYVGMLAFFMYAILRLVISGGH